MKLLLAVSMSLATVYLPAMGQGAGGRVGGTPLASDTVIPTVYDTMQTGTAPEVRFAKGAITGMAVGAILAAQNAACAPATSAVESGMLTGLWGGIRAVVAGSGDRPRGVPVLTDPRDPGPYPMDQKECGKRSTGGHDR